MFDGLTLCKAENGGFYVMSALRPHDAVQILYAGSLDRCLGYIEKRMSEASSD